MVMSESAARLPTSIADRLRVGLTVAADLLQMFGDFCLKSLRIFNQCLEGDGLRFEFFRRHAFGRRHAQNNNKISGPSQS